MANAEKKTEDVEMKDAAPEAEKKPEVVPFALDKGMCLLVHNSLFTYQSFSLLEIQANLVLVHRAIDSLEPRLTARALRNLTTLRKHTLHADAFKDILATLYQKGTCQTFLIGGTGG